MGDGTLSLRCGSKRKAPIFQFHDMDDLLLVLAHEMGHALGLNHIEPPEAIMHALMGSQNINDLAPTPADIEALQAMCGNGN
ncbi:matrixin family metalloprotease [Candidatus Entotheonella palauensis]|uniref:matrixin family metalloprotease n=1 Tax=Candidatus Entotheonella palauensis TaxID=93172 RepID=UPI000B7E1B12|nr:matrixin family metalloprotease [Candidatus Entotheonella palauensis]